MLSITINYKFLKETVDTEIIVVVMIIVIIDAIVVTTSTPLVKYIPWALYIIQIVVVNLKIKIKSWYEKN